MIDLNSNMDEVIGRIKASLESLKTNPDPLLRACALAVLPEMRERVHVKGLDSNGQAIGTYTPGYMDVRTGNFKNSKRVTRGVRKGDLKDAGNFTKKGFTKFTQQDEETVTSQRFFLKLGNTGAARPKYNRTADTKVILSLTRQMEGDLSVIDTENGYGIGYKNPDNFKKAIWCEATYKKQILTKLTADEVALAQKTAIEFLPTYLKKA